MIVALGTKNPAKVEGVRLAFSKYFPRIEIRTIDSGPVTKAQPFGLDQMTQGAIVRAKFALSKLGGEFGVGVEAGIFLMGETYFDHQQAAIVDAAGKVSVGHSAGYSLPRDAVEKMIREGRELEQYAETISGVGQIGDKGGLVHHLTKGMMTRTELTEQCVLMALIPRLHKDVYGL
ncbi:MAG: inosine/xanthosine triphosphatase [Nitrososphaerales archaeon]|nr:inosine/xanthosine triphosphatase [Nitrososphaerales archaeon]